MQITCYTAKNVKSVEIAKRQKMDYEISKPDYCFRGAELRTNFQDKLLNFQFCVIQLRKSFFKFRCNPIGSSNTMQLY